MQFMEVLPTIVIERTMDLGYNAIILLAALPFVVGAEGTERIGYVVGAVVLAGFGMLLRNSEHKGNATYDLVKSWASNSIGTDPFGYRGEFLRLVGMAGLLDKGNGESRK